MDTQQIDTGKAIGYGWTSVKKDFWYFVGIALIVFIIESVGNGRHPSTTRSLIALLLSTWMTCGYFTLMLSYHRGQKLPLSTIFTSVKQYWNVLGASILLGIIIGVGIMFLIVPGIFLALMYQFTIPLIIDKNLGIIDAMKRSAALAKGRKLSLLGFDVALLGIVILGAICLGVGLLVAMPVALLASIFVYRTLEPIKNE